MSERIFAKRNGAPWVTERRQPTRAELAAKHSADGGGVASPPGANTLPDDVDGDSELVELESMPGTFVRKPKSN